MVGSLLREFVVAWNFGAGDALDAYLMAFLVPCFLYLVLSEPIKTALIPIYYEVKVKEGNAHAERLISEVIFFYGAFLLIIMLILFSLVSLFIPLLSNGFSPEKTDLTVKLSYILLPIIVLQSYCVLFSGLLNSDDKFALPALSKGLIPISVLAFLLMGKETLGIYSLAFGYIFGVVLQLIVLLTALLKQGRKFTFTWQINMAIKQICRHYVPLAVGQFLAFGIGLVGSIMAASLESGSVTAFIFGKKLVDGISLILVGGLAAVFLPFFSKMTANENWDELLSTFRLFSKWISGVTVPIAIIIYYYSEPLIRFFFERGEFSSSDTVLVSSVQAMHVLRLPFQALNIIGFHLLCSLKENRPIMKILALSLGVSIGLNFVFLEIFGVAGLTLSSTIAMAFSTGLIYLKIRSTLETRILKNQGAYALPGKMK
jgi:putative peptidoglycan lipid II flippase